MTRFNLSLTDSAKIFKSDTESKNLQRLLKSLDAEQINLLQDPDKLEELYLIDRVNDLQKVEFRIELLSYSFGKPKFKKFCQKINQFINVNNSSIAERKQFVKKIASFNWGDNLETHSFIESFELQDIAVISTPVLVSDLETLSSNPQAYNSLFLYQNEILNKINNSFRFSGAKRLIQVPTGGGKTKIAMEIVTDFMNNNQNSTIVWLAESRELLEQAINEFKKIWIHRGKTGVTINRLWDKHNFVEGVGGSKIIFAGLSKINNFFKKGNTLQADFIIFDEAHHASAPVYSEIIEKLKKIGKTRVLGLTATPGRTNPDETQVLSDVFDDNQPITIETHDENVKPIEFLQKMGVLSQIRIGGDRIIKIKKLETVLTAAELRELQRKSEYPNDSKVIKKIGNDYLRNMIIYNKLSELLSEKRQIIYFGTSVEQSRLMYLLLTNFNFKVGFIDDSTSTDKRVDLIKKFDNKEINCLLNYGVLTAGFDSPSIDTVFIARLTKSPNTLFQMIGRGIRGPIVKNGTKFCDVYHVQDGYLDRFENFEQLYESYDEYFMEKLASGDD